MWAVLGWRSCLWPNRPPPLGRLRQGTGGFPATVHSTRVRTVLLFLRTPDHPGNGRITKFNPTGRTDEMRNLLKRRNLLLATVAGLGIAASSAGAGTWVAAVPVQGSSSTTVFGVNDTDIITGGYVDASGATH